jgi:hypothetical protein
MKPRCNRLMAVAAVQVQMLRFDRRTCVFWFGLTGGVGAGYNGKQAVK